MCKIFIYKKRRLCTDPKKLDFFCLTFRVQFIQGLILCVFLILYSSKIKLKLRQLSLIVQMLLTSSVLSATSKRCFELTSSVLSTTSKQCFEQPAASFLVCSLIFIEYNNYKTNLLTYLYKDNKNILQSYEVIQNEYKK